MSLIDSLREHVAHLSEDEKYDQVIEDHEDEVRDGSSGVAIPWQRAATSVTV